MESTFIAERRAWLIAQARRICSDPSRTDDLAQEGSIALWRAYRDLEDTPEPDRTRFALHRARQRMKHIAWKGEPPLGHAPMRGRPEVEIGFSMDALEGWQREAFLGAEDMLGDVEMAYHRGELAAALQSLPTHHQEYVKLRFWWGYTDTEIAALWGLSSSKVVEKRWSRTIRPALAERLPHLAG